MTPITPISPAFIEPFTILEGILFIAALILAFMVWRLTRHQECDYTEAAEPSIDQALPALVGSTHSHLHSGNAVELFQNEEFFDAVVQAIDDATVSVHLETFLWHDSDAGNRVTRALMAAAQRGVAVRVLGDAAGTFKLPNRTFRRLRKAGCQARRFHRWSIMNFGRWNVRDHRKIVVIDGKIAFVGGHCLSDEWYTGNKQFSRFRDITARIEGPVVASVQSCFFENWLEVTGELFVDDTAFPPLEAVGEVLAHTSYLSPDGCPSSVQVLHHLSIGYAKKRIWIQNPYFMPDPNGATALVNAAKRGVDVRVMIPALSATDSPIVSRAGRFQFRRLLESGVRIFEYQKTLLHQKVISVDSVWCGIGSSNFDDRSFEINKEITVGYADVGLATQLEEIFHDDLKHCEELLLDKWLQRPRWKRALSGLLYLFNEQL